VEKENKIAEQQEKKKAAACKEARKKSRAENKVEKERDARAEKITRDGNAKQKTRVNRQRMGRTGNFPSGALIRRTDTTYSSCFIISVEGRPNTDLRQTQVDIISKVLDISHDLDDTSVEHLSDSRPAPVLDMLCDIPEHLTLIHAYIRAVSGYSNLKKVDKRIQFVIRIAHNLEAQDLARSISGDLQTEIGAQCYVKRLNLPHTTYVCWLKGILTTSPEDAVKDYIVSDLLASNYGGTRGELTRKVGFEKKQVWVNDVIRKKEER
jgi:hypothetical protein